jgi:hypothetical protein
MERFTTYFLCSLVEREKELVRAEEVGHTSIQQQPWSIDCDVQHMLCLRIKITRMLRCQIISCPNPLPKAPSTFID